MIRRALAAGALAAGLLGGCAVAPPVPPEAVWTVGRLSLQVDAGPDRPAHALNAGFELRGNGERGELRLISPLGSQVAAARWSPADAELQTSGGTRRFADLDALTREALGEALPLRALPDWLAGRPWSGAVSAARVDGFEQLGWRIGLARWHEGQVVAQRDAPPAVQLRVRLETAP